MPVISKRGDNPPPSGAGVSVHASSNFFKQAPAMRGMLARKENSADFSGLMPDMRAAEMVMPERLTPGKMAMACAIPMKRARPTERPLS